MRRVRVLVIGVVLAAIGLVAASPNLPTASAAQTKNVYTPVLAQLLAPNDPAPVLGTDRKYHVIYELRLANRGPIPATLERLDVLDADSRATVHTFEGQDLQGRVRDIGGVTAADTVIEPGGERLFLVDLEFAVSLSVPDVLMHRLELLGPKAPKATAATPVSYTIAPVAIDGPAPALLVPPLRGNGWVITSGCCDVGNPDRTAILPVNGGLWNPRRFAVDLMQLDDGGVFVHDDPTQLGNFTSYGADVLAVAPGRVVALLDTLPDQPFGGAPDSSASSFESADGNYVVIDLGNGSFAFYGNLQPGSLTVEVGDRVQRREVLATLGNSGDSIGPAFAFPIDGRRVAVRFRWAAVRVHRVLLRGPARCAAILLRRGDRELPRQPRPEPGPPAPRAPARLFDHRFRCCRGRGRRRTHIAPARTSTMPSTARRLLVATPTLLDPNFFRTVVFMIEHTSDAALGVVLNRVSDATLDEAVPEWCDLAATPRVAFVGGPVQPHEAVIALGRGQGDLQPADGWYPLLGAVGTVDLGRSPPRRPSAGRGDPSLRGLRRLGPGSARRRALGRRLVRGRRRARRSPHRRSRVPVAPRVAPPGR